MIGLRWGVIFVFYLSLVQSSIRKDQEYWKKLSTNELEEALAVKWNLGEAKNVILFIGDGMGPNTVTATRIHKGGEGHRLTYEKFPHIGLLKTYSANKMVPDSTSTATALLCGVKANFYTMGVDASVEHNNCSASLRPEARLESLAALALKAGKSAGFVTTMRVTHATPGPIYAHSASRLWECDSAMPRDSSCKDIGRQLVEDWPGRDLHVILGGGRQGLVAKAQDRPSDPVSAWGCNRSDGRDLITQYIKDKEERGLRHSVVSNTAELKNIDKNTDYLLGIFSNAHMPYEFQRTKDPHGPPSIVEMTEAAIKVLKRNKNGFFLMVEGGNIDMAHHRGRARTAVDESLAMEEAVSMAVNMTSEEDTLIVVTSDHTHTLSINGYPDRGSDIFGTTGPSKFDGLNYSTLTYGVGGPGSNKLKVQIVDDQPRIVRTDPDTENTTSFMYEQASAILNDENVHGGGDVAIYARGPYAHLFHNVHEQHYVFHAISYAAKIGAFSKASKQYNNVYICLLTLLLGFMFRMIN